MKSLSYIYLACFLIVMYGCKEEEHPYVGYLLVDRVVMEAAGGTVTVTADTDLSEPIQFVKVNEASAEWCSVSINGKEITITASQPNTSTDAFRTATVSVRSGYRLTEFSVLQKYQGQQYLQYDWATWEAVGSDVQAGDGGGYPSLFDEERTTFWHSQYSPSVPLPHTLIIDMKKELSVAMLQIGRRANGTNNYGSVKKMEIYASIDKDNYTLVGGFTFAIPWTAPDGTVVTSPTGPLIPPYEEILFSESVTARYMKLVITETNNTNGVAQVAFFKAYEKL